MNIYKISSHKYKHDVFISHATEDKETLVIPLYNQLKKKGLNVWFDKESINTGENISEKVFKGIKEARLIVLILSKSSIKKVWPWIELGVHLLNKDNIESYLYPLRSDATLTEIKDAYSSLGDIKIEKITTSNINIIADDISRKICTKKQLEDKNANRNKYIVMLIASVILLGSIAVLAIVRSIKQDTKVYQSSNKFKTLQPSEKSKLISNQTFNVSSDTIRTNFTKKNNEFAKTKALVNNKEFNKFLNTSLINSTNKMDYSVTIIDSNNYIEQELSSEIANLYNNNGHYSKIGFLKQAFINEPNFSDIYDGDLRVIEKFNLKNHTDYLVLGKIRINKKNGELIKGTIICSIICEVRIISTLEGLIKSFSISANGNGMSFVQAKELAINQLLYNYSKEI